MDLRIFTEPQQGATYDDQLAVATPAEELGFDAFFRSDHYMKMGDVSGLPGPTDAWITLAGLARETTRIRLGTLVSPVTFRHPGPLAISVAQVDAMSGGRVELGLGAGWYDDEHAAYGIPFPPIGERFDRLEEQLAIITGLWATPVGETFSLRRARTTRSTTRPALPKPVQQPRPPIIIGGCGPKRTPRAGRQLRRRVQHAVRPARGSGHGRPASAPPCEARRARPGDAASVGRARVCCGADEAEVDAPGGRHRSRAGRAARERRWRARRRGGRRRSAPTREPAPTRIYLQVLDLDDLDHLRLMAAEVMPAVA